MSFSTYTLSFNSTHQSIEEICGVVADCFLDLTNQAVVGLNLVGILCRSSRRPPFVKMRHEQLRIRSQSRELLPSVEVNQADDYQLNSC